LSRCIWSHVSVLLHFLKFDIIFYTGRCCIWPSNLLGHFE
jgi:hypothetical protein